MKIFLMLIVSSLLFSIQGMNQSTVDIRFENTIHGITTIVKVQRYENGIRSLSQGTGFFYHTYLDTNLAEILNPIDSNIKKIYLITNKHVIFGETFNYNNLNYPELLQFYVREQDPISKRNIWDSINIPLELIKKKIKIHSKTSVDVAAIDITDEIFKLKRANKNIIYSAISKMNFPNGKLSEYSSQGDVTLSAGVDILSIGYPKEFYDYINLYPTVKSGIIASKWKYKYNGEDFFLIDGKLFPGSSGSLIISRPVFFCNIPGTNNRFDYFVFLGVYSGELYFKSEEVEFENMTIRKKDIFNTGIVWYYYLIDEMLQ